MTAHVESFANIHRLTYSPKRTQKKRKYEEEQEDDQMPRTLPDHPSFQTFNDELKKQAEAMGDGRSISVKPQTLSFETVKSNGTTEQVKPWQCEIIGRKYEKPQSTLYSKMS